MDDAVPVVLKAHDTFSPSDIKITKIDIVLSQSRFEALKTAMARIGVTGMTVSSVFGCGTQKGRTDFYRGVEYEMNLLPKIKVEIVISKIPVSEVINTAREVLYTGNIGDGKIFVYDVENVIRVRTGEDGYDALQSGKLS
jgi:Amt family ammonium transporter